MGKRHYIAIILAVACILFAEAKSGKRQISENLFGIFFEDLNYAADGGLYAELVQNRSFEYSPSYAYIA